MGYEEDFYVLTKRRVLYNIMPLINIPSVLTHGILSYNESLKYKHESIAMNEVQERRNKVVTNGMPLHSYANLYFDPRNPMMYIRKDKSKELCILAINAIVLNFQGVVITDRNASSNWANFLQPSEMLFYLNFETIYMKNWNHSNEIKKYEQKSQKCAEILIPNSIPTKYIVGAYVVNKEIEEKLRSYGFERQIKIDSYLFFCEEVK